MKGLITGSLMLVFLIASLPRSEAALWGKKKEEPAKSTPTTQTEVKKATPPISVQKVDNKAKVEAINARKALVDKKRSELNNTEWSLELTPVATGPKVKKEAETLIFRNNQISVSGYIGLHFPSTNYTLSPQPDGSAIFETMQTSEKSPATVVFWRGEVSVDAQNVRGMLSYHIDEKTTKDFSFVSIGKKALVFAPAK